MFSIILTTIIICALVQIAINYPKKIIKLLGNILSKPLPLIKKYSPRIGMYYELLIHRMVNINEPNNTYNFSHSGVYSLDKNYDAKKEYRERLCRHSKPFGVLDDNLTNPQHLPKLDENNEDNCQDDENSLNENMPFEKYLKNYENKYDTKVIFINHEEKSMYGLFNTNEQLGQKDAKNFINIMRDIPEDKHISLFLITNGGSLTSAEIIINSLLSHKGQIDVYIPYNCMSAGTLIALACDNIYMDKNAHCGPIDPQIYGISVTSIIRYYNYYSNRNDNNGFNSIVSDIIKIAYSQANASINRVKEVVTNINEQKNKIENVNKVFEELLSGKYNHDKPLFCDYMKKLLPYVNIGLPDNVSKLHDKFTKKDDCKSNGINGLHNIF